MAHRQAAAVEPAPIDLTELGVAIAGGMLLEALEVEQFEGDRRILPTSHFPDVCTDVVPG